MSRTKTIFSGSCPAVLRINTVVFYGTKALSSANSVFKNKDKKAEMSSNPLK
uniref:Uncharacterized protein n=1 Tax=Arundo donax TaxID=35708 RepID=A0A0A8ZLN6_ARUDO